MNFQTAAESILLYLIKHFPVEDDYQIVLYTDKSRTQLEKNVRSHYIDKFVRRDTLMNLTQL